MNMSKYRHVVIITAADNITGMATARSLLDANYYIIGIAKNIGAPACSSKAWQKVYLDCGERLTLLKKIVDDLHNEGLLNKPLLLPCQDEWVLWLSENKYRVIDVIDFQLPETQALTIGMDKAAFYSYAVNHGFKVPRTIIVKNVKDLIDSVKLFDGQKFIIKPEVRLADWDLYFSNTKLFFFNDADEFYNSKLNLEKLFECCNSLLLQQWIDGDDSDVYFVLMAIDKRGLILDHFCGRKLLQWPRKSGSTAICVKDSVSEIIMESRRLAIQLNFIGLCSVEFKKDKGDSSYYITEPTVGRNDFQSSVADINGKNLTLTLVNEHFYPDAPTSDKKKTVNNKIWVEEIGALRALKSSKINNFTLKFLLLNAFRISTVAFKFRDTRPIYRTLLSFKKAWSKK